MKKTGDSAKVVDRAQAKSQTKPGTVGVKVSILKADAVLKDRITVDEKLVNKLKQNLEKLEKPSKKKKTTKKKEE